MLDKKTKDVDASIELLEDRKQLFEIVFFIFFIFGWISVCIGSFLVPSKYDEIVMSIGIALLIFATWWWITFLYYTILICCKKIIGDKK